MNDPRFDSLFPPDVAFVWQGQAMEPPPELLLEEEAVLGPRPAPRRRRDFAMGRACARAAVARLQGLEEFREPLLRSRGRAPRWPAGVVGTITHTAGMAAAAAAHAEAYLGIGLDLERLPRVSPRLMRRVCRPEERAVLESLNETTGRRALGAIFSAKESIFKALNPATGVFLGFQDAELEALPVAEGNEGPFTWRLHRSCGPALPVGFTGKGKLAFRGDCVLTAVWVERPREA